MVPEEVPEWCRSRNGGRGGGRGGGGRGGGGRGGGGVASERRVVRIAPPATQETSEDDWMQLNQHLHATFKNMSGEEIRANIAPAIIEESLVRLREVSGDFQFCAVVWITKLRGQTAGDERPVPNVNESRPHSEEESRLEEQQRAEEETRTKRRADEPREKQRAEDETRSKRRADEPREKQRAENETRAKQAASSPNEEDEENEEHSSSRKKQKYDRNCWYVVCATMIIVMRVLRKRNRSCVFTIVSLLIYYFVSSS
jgi:hypothetical protein